MDCHPDLRRETARGALVMSLQPEYFFGNLQLVGFSDRRRGNWRTPNIKLRTDSLDAARKLAMIYYL
jgi:hypothetical protein